MVRGLERVNIWKFFFYLLDLSTTREKHLLYKMHSIKRNILKLTVFRNFDELKIANDRFAINQSFSISKVSCRILSCIFRVELRNELVSFTDTCSSVGSQWRICSVSNFLTTSDYQWQDRYSRSCCLSATIQEAHTDMTFSDLQLHISDIYHVITIRSLDYGQNQSTKYWIKVVYNIRAVRKKKKR